MQFCKTFKKTITKHFLGAYSLFVNIIELELHKGCNILALSYNKILTSGKADIHAFRPSISSQNSRTSFLFENHASWHRPIYCDQFPSVTSIQSSLFYFQLVGHGADLERGGGERERYPGHLCEDGQQVR